MTVQFYENTGYWNINIPLQRNGHFCQKIIPICKTDHFEPNNLMLQSMHSSITDFQLEIQSHVKV